MDIKRYIQVEVVVLDDKSLIPVWDERVTYGKTDSYGTQINIRGINKNFYSVTPAVYDLKTKVLSLGIEIDVYPDESKLEFKKEESIYFEKSHRNLIDETIVDIVYVDYDMNVHRGKKIKDWYKDKDIKEDALYVVKNWKPFYVLSDGTKVEYVHKMYHKGNAKV